VNPEEAKIAESAYVWAKDKSNWGPIVSGIVDGIKAPGSSPYAIFMAGSPGAGKTEFSKHFLDISGLAEQVVRIDPDIIRSKVYGYEPGRAHLVQHATSKIVERVYDKVLHEGMNFLLDGTFSNEAKALENIKRAIDHAYSVQINFVYQEPGVAWEFTKKREEVEGRNIPLEAFVGQFFESRRIVNEIKKKYAEKVSVDLIRRNIRAGNYDYSINIESLDGYIKDNYSPEELIKVLS
jgi:predicted ABC-type ATPase